MHRSLEIIEGVYVVVAYLLLPHILIIYGTYHSYSGRKAEERLPVSHVFNYVIQSE